jgi:hypothetical protein
MKLVTFIAPGGAQHIGALLPGETTLVDFTASDTSANRYLFGIGTARLDPASVELPRVWYERPIYYKGNCFSVVGTGCRKLTGSARRFDRRAA